MSTRPSAQVVGTWIQAGLGLGKKCHTQNKIRTQFKAALPDIF